MMYGSHINVSVIVPVYNVEKYLPECIDSILAQTFTAFELILINDGSVDSSGQICDDYALEDSRVRVFHRTNSGVSATRNFGIDKALGKYCCFVDSDDTVSVDYLKNLLRYSSDMAVSCIKKQIIPTSSAICFSVERSGLYHRNDFAGIIPCLESKSLLNGPCSKLFRVDLIRCNNISFPCGYSFGEDTMFVFSYLLHISSLSVVNSIDYNYFIRNEKSLITQRSFQESELRWAYGMLLLRESVADKFKIVSRKYRLLTFKSFYAYFFRAVHSIYTLIDLPKEERVKSLAKIYATKCFSEKVFFELAGVQSIIPILLFKIGNPIFSDALYRFYFKIRRRCINRLGAMLFKKNFDGLFARYFYLIYRALS